MYIKRAIEESVLNISKTFPILLMTGPRYVGKTALLKRLAGEDRKYVTMDDPDARYLAQNDPAMFIQRYSPPVIIDEIQYAPGLMSYIKVEVDNSGSKGDYWLTDSQMFNTMKIVGDTLAGRVGIIKLLGLSNSEINGTASMPFTTSSERLGRRLEEIGRMELGEVYERIHRGGMPALYVNDDIDPEVFFASYINSYLQRDIKDLNLVTDEMSFFNFMSCVAARTAKPVVYDELAKEAGISAPTAKKWLSILVSSHIVALVQPYQNSALKRTIRTPLLHFLDTGLCAYLLKWRNAEVLERGAMAEPFFESWVFSEIYKSYLNSVKEPPLFYYRDKDKKEVDLIIAENGVLYPIEIKKIASTGTEAARMFKALNPVTEPELFGSLEQYKMDIGEGSVICLSKDLTPADKQNWFVPAWLI
ncbi:MAG: ATP-binding protein [Oscillospiraceae bacterium]|jgi:predicted AAA+ superfamily ATPase|nr:ATP-binding protein [Oscillospiraceae bacterium]